MSEGHAHGEDAWTDTAVVRYLISDDGARSSIHNEPDIGFDATDCYVGFISSKYVSRFIIVVVNEGFNTDSGSFAVVSYLLVRDADVIKVFHCGQGIAAMRAGKTYRSCNNFAGGESLTTDFTLVLSVSAIVIVEEMVRSTTQRTDSIRRNF